MKIIKNENGKHGIAKLRVAANAHLHFSKGLVDWLNNRSVTISVDQGQLYLADNPEGDVNITKSGTCSAAKLVRDSFWSVHPDTRKKSTAYEVDILAKPVAHEGLLFYPIIRLDK